MNFLEPNLKRFLTISVSIYLIWFIIYDLWLKTEGTLDSWLTKTLTDNTITCLRWLKIQSFHSMQGKDHIIMGPDKKIIEISNACNGLVLYPLYIGFILAIPGRAKWMVVMALIGSIIIFVVNVLRAVILCLIKIHYPLYLDFNHRYTFAIMVYAVIFFLWFIWINKFSILKGRLNENKA